MILHLRKFESISCKKPIISPSPLSDIMQVQEKNGNKKTITITPDVHRKIVSLRRGKQTYGDVVAASIAALEREMEHPDIPCIDDIDMAELDKQVDEWEKEPEKHYITLDESRKRYEEKHKIV